MFNSSRCLVWMRKGLNYLEKPQHHIGVKKWFAILCYKYVKEKLTRINILCESNLFWCWWKSGLFYTKSDINEFVDLGNLTGGVKVVIFNNLFGSEFWYLAVMGHLFLGLFLESQQLGRWAWFILRKGKTIDSWRNTLWLFLHVWGQVILRTDLFSSENCRRSLQEFNKFESYCC